MVSLGRNVNELKDSVSDYETFYQEVTLKLYQKVAVDIISYGGCNVMVLNGVLRINLS